MKKKTFGIKWKELVTNKAFDLIIVILGVTIAFQLNNLKQHSDNKSLENFYLESILMDLSKDLEEYQDNLSVIQFNHTIARKAIAKWSDTTIPDSIGFIVARISSIKTFEGHNNTYSTIRNENGLSLIDNTEIRNLILDHYRLYASIDRFESVYLDHTKNMQAFFTQYLDYSHLADQSKFGTGESIKTKNMVIISLNQLQNGIWRYQGSIDKAKELKKSIEQYLSK
jgi:hypothetical protein